MAELRKRIIKYRAMHNMSQRAFAVHAGVSQMTILNIEKCGKWHKPSEIVLQKIEMALQDETGGAENELV